eukprot:m.253530 g.253530  ORF g.253530 m.253530 type:complete len:188 (-) comp26521_c3_seq1:32-595(-)
MVTVGMATAPAVPLVPLAIARLGGCMSLGWAVSERAVVTARPGARGCSTLSTPPEVNFLWAARPAELAVVPLPGCTTLLSAKSAITPRMMVIGARRPPTISRAYVRACRDTDVRRRVSDEECDECVAPRPGDDGAPMLPSAADDVGFESVVPDHRSVPPLIQPAPSLSLYHGPVHPTPFAIAIDPKT